MRRMTISLAIALLLTLSLLCSCSSGWFMKLDRGGIFGIPEREWDVTMYMDYDCDGDIDTVIYHYTLWKNGDIDVTIEVID